MRKNSEASNGAGRTRRVSIGFLVVAVLVAFVAGNRFQFIGDWFFAPYGTSSNASLGRSLDFSSAEQVYDLLKKEFDGKLDAEQLQDGLKKGLVEAAGDPYTTYLTAKEAAQFNEDLNGSFSGIGAELGRRDDALVVIAPVAGAPAQKAGLRPNDKVVSINNEDTTNLSVDEAVNKIRGEVGTKVKLGIMRAGEVKEYEITRSQITVPSVESEILAGNIGYIKISRFSDDTAELAKQAAADFKQKQVKGVIVDVRNNGGGLLSSSVDVAGLWLDSKVVVQEKRGEKVVSSLKTGENPPLGGIPTVVLTNGGSASASEILAGALNDHGAATIVGEKTFGKGSVQALYDIEGGGKLKVTIARWFTPKGKNIDKEGIKPDIEVKLTEQDYNKDRDPQKDRALQELR